jgi:hypothetical protein
MRRYKVAICRFPGSGWEHNGCVTWLMKTFGEMLRDPTIEHVDTLTETDTPITMVRNRLVKQALDLGSDYILMVDSDMVPDYLVGRKAGARPFWATAWAWMMRRRQAEAEAGDLLAHEHNALFAPATIAAPYCGPPPDECVLIFKWKDRETGARDPNFRLEMFEREEAAFRSGFEEVAAMGTGLILYDSRVFRRLKAPWFAYEYGDVEETIKASTEDVYQTRNASMLKLPQMVLWCSWAAHVKPKYVLKPNPLTRDQVHESLVEAALQGRDSKKTLAFVTRHDGPPLPLVPRVSGIDLEGIKIAGRCLPAEVTADEGDVELR